MKETSFEKSYRKVVEDMCKYVVVDLEMCEVPKAMRTQKYHWATETIQIGAVLLNENYEIVKQFNTYVSPEFGRMNFYISNLTGICDEDLQGAPKMETALKMFAEWLPDEEVLGVSWSDVDERQIRRELEGKEIQIEKLETLLDNWIDCQKCFGGKISSEKCYSLWDALLVADIEAEGRKHDGLADAYNTAVLFAKLETEEELQLHPLYQSAIEEAPVRLGFSLGDLFTGLNLQSATG